MTEKDRLRWRCRRGMLELDLILLRFLEEQYPELSPAEQRTFETLLQLQDDALLRLVSGDGIPPGDERAGVVERLRQC